MNIQVNSLCAQGSMGRILPFVHDMHMADRQRHFLREWRKHRGKTLEQVAEVMHMTHGNLSKIERGKVPYTQDLLEKLAELYMCSVPDLIIRDPSDPTGIWTVWENAKPGDKRKIVSAARIIVGDDERDEKVA